LLRRKEYQLLERKQILMAKRNISTHTGEHSRTDLHTQVGHGNKNNYGQNCSYSISVGAFLLTLKDRKLAEIGFFFIPYFLFILIDF
jgi:hypothetical protein